DPPREFSNSSSSLPRRRIPPPYGSTGAGRADGTAAAPAAAAPPWADARTTFGRGAAAPPTPASAGEAEPAVAAVFTGRGFSSTGARSYRPSSSSDFVSRLAGTVIS